MQSFKQTRSMQASAEEVFDFVTDLDNLPLYLPTVHRATPQGEDRIRIQGEAAGKGYDDTGYFQVDRDNRRMEWGSDGDSGYSGWLHVQERDLGTCEVLVELKFDPRNPALREMDARKGNPKQIIEDGIRKTLDSIKQQCEGAGVGRASMQRH